LAKKIDQNPADESSRGAFRANVNNIICRLDAIEIKTAAVDDMIRSIMCELAWNLATGGTMLEIDIMTAIETFRLATIANGAADALEYRKLMNSI
jgi:hypothetical protein